MSDLEEYIKRITEKLQFVLKRQSFLQKENDKLRNELFETKAREEQKDEELKLLSLRIDVLKASHGDMNADDKKSLEKKINQYLKEVDKCISLLKE